MLFAEFCSSWKQDTAALEKRCEIRPQTAALGELLALATMPLEVDLRNIADDACFPFLVGNLHLRIRQAGHFSAVQAHKVGMHVVCLVVLAPELEPPGVIPGIKS